MFVKLETFLQSNFIIDVSFPHVFETVLAATTSSNQSIQIL